MCHSIILYFFLALVEARRTQLLASAQNPLEHSGRPQGTENWFGSSNIGDKITVKQIQGSSNWEV